MRKFLNECGYQSGHELLMSICPSFKYKLELLTISLASASGIIEVFLGLKSLTVVAFICLLSIELMSGIYASVFVKKQKLQSGKLSRFGIKLALLLITFFVLNTFTKEYETRNTLVSGLFAWLHSAIMVYASCEYLVSVLENFAVISGKSKNTLITAIKKKLDSFLGNDENEQQ